MHLNLIKNSVLLCTLIPILFLASCKTVTNDTSLTTIDTKPTVTTYSTLLPALTAQLQHTHVQITDKGSYVNIVILSHYIFAQNGSINNNFKPYLNIIMHNLKKHHYKKIIVAGYTDNHGSLLHNENISKTWAKAIVTYFISQGISRNTITTEANGEYAPIASNYTFAGRMLNRRVEIHVYSEPTKEFGK